MSQFYQKIYEIVQKVPFGKVASYKQIAVLAGSPLAARQVGYAMAALPPGSSVPWHRIINSRGEIPIKDPAGAKAQRQRLLLEGIAFNSNGRINLDTFGWDGKTS
jgi:O-6-methylguanine DNA methyltransferase